MTGTPVAELMVKIGADLKGLTKDLNKVEGKFKAMGKRLQGIGRTMTFSVTAPLVAAGILAVKNYDTQAKAIAKVEAGLKSMGTTGVGTIEELKRKASDLQRNSLFGDEDILDGVTAQMLTFGNVTGAQFDRAQQASIDLAAKLNTDLKGAAIQVGKALNDPATGLSMLTRVGITFTEEQKSLIKALQAGGDAAGAQSVILSELERQFGGTAAAMARVGAGPIKQLQMAMGDLSESFGEVIAEALIPAADFMRGLAVRFGELDEKTRKVIVSIGLAVAAIGPLTFALGALMAVVSPVTLAIAGLVTAGAVLWANWDVVTHNIRQAWLATKGVVLLAMAEILEGTSKVIQFVPGIGGSSTAVKAAADAARQAGKDAGKEYLEGWLDAPDVEMPDVSNLLGLTPSAGGDEGAGGTGRAADAAHAALLAWRGEMEGVEASAMGTLETFKATTEPAMKLRESGEVAAAAWSTMRAELEWVNERMADIGANMRIAFVDVLSQGIGQFLTLQGSLKDIFQSIKQSIKQILGDVIALIVKQKLMNLLVKEEAVTRASMGGFAGLTGVGKFLGIGALVAGGIYGLGKAFQDSHKGSQVGSFRDRDYSGHAGRATTKVQLQGVAVPQGDIYFSAQSHANRLGRLGA